MSSVVILLSAVVVLILGYIFYGGWIVKQWRVDKNEPTPANTLNDGVDYVPTRPIVLFGHHFSSIAGAGPVNGPIIAAMFGWVPVFLWIVLGSIFIGAVQDFGSLLASLRNEGKTIGFLVEKYLGRSGKNIFLIFVYLLLLLVVAAFTDIVSKTFSAGVNVSGASGGSTATASVTFVFIAMGFGYFVYLRKMPLLNATIIGLILLSFGILLGFYFPLNMSTGFWVAAIMVYIYIASATPVWFVLQPRDYLNSFLLYFMMITSFIGILFVNPTVNMPAFNGFVVDGKYLFPMLFIMVACGAVSGFHSLVASGSASKQLNHMRYAKSIGYGAMILEAVLAIIALIAVGSLFAGSMPVGAPPVIFASSMASTVNAIGVPHAAAYLLMTLTLSAFELTTLDSAARIGRLTVTELIITSKDDLNNLPKVKKFFTNKYVASLLVIFPAYLLAEAGYENIWPLFGSANQLMAALALLAVSLWLKRSGMNNKMTVIPMIFMIIVTLSSLALIGYNDLRKAFTADGFLFYREGLQIVFTVLFLIMSIFLLFKSYSQLRKKADA